MVEQSGRAMIVSLPLITITIKRLRLGRAMTPFLALLLTLQLPTALAAAGSGVIEEIRFSGNKVTQEIVMRQEMLVREGDPIDMGKIEKSRQAIMNRGLFKRVDAEVLQEDGKNVLLITVEERFYILPLPLLDARLEEEVLSYGFELRHDNLLGLNQRLKWAYEHKKSANSEIPMRKETSLDYSYPRVLGSSENLSIFSKIIREDIEELENTLVTGTYRQDSRNFGFRVSRWLAGRDSISQGWLLGGGMTVAQQIFSHQQGTGERFDDSQALEINVGLDYSDVAEYPYYREGSAYGYWLAVSLPGMGSDYSYNRAGVYHRNYHVLDIVDASFHTQVKLGIANGSSFDSPAYSVGGGSSLRGYESDFARGNLLFQLNAEYHHHLSGYRQLRGVVFMDVGNAWSGGDEVNGKLFTGVGLGLRWRVQSFVDVTLRVDTAYAVDTGETKLYASTSSSF